MIAGADRDSAMRPTIELGVLAFWLGAAVLTSGVVAPAAFAVAPNAGIAGDFVGRVLPSIFYGGVVAGLIAAALARESGWRFAGRETASFVAALACGVAQWVLDPRIERIRASVGGPISTLAHDDPRRAAFGALHGASLGCLGLAMIAALLAAIGAGRAAVHRK